MRKPNTCAPLQDQIRGQDILNEFLNKPYQDGICVRLGGSAEMQKAFEDLAGDAQIIESSRTVVQFKLLPTGYVVEKRSQDRKSEVQQSEYSIGSGKEFLESTLSEVNDDFRRAQRQMQELKRMAARNGNAISVLAKALASLETIISFDRLVGPH